MTAPESTECGGLDRDSAGEMDGSRFNRSCVDDGATLGTGTTTWGLAYSTEGS